MIRAAVILTALTGAAAAHSWAFPHPIGRNGAAVGAVNNVQPTGWLPPELRCATYSGLGEIPLTIAASPIEPDLYEIEDEALDEVA